MLSFRVVDVKLIVFEYLIKLFNDFMKNNRC